MNHDCQNKNNCTEIMFEDEILIDLEAYNLSNDQTWLLHSEEDSGNNVDVRDWLSEDVSTLTSSADYVRTLKELFSSIDKCFKNDTSPERQKFDSRTYKKPNKRVSRPSLNTMVEALSPPTAARPQLHSHMRNINQAFSANPILRLKTFNVDVDTENCTAVKEFALKRRSLIQEDEPVDDVELMSSTALETSMNEATIQTSKPINIDLSQPAHNLHRMSRFPVTIPGDDGSLSLLKSGESFMNMSPPSLVNSIVMETSGTFLPESTDSRKSLLGPRNSNNYVPHSGKESIDHQSMISSMTLSILDDKDMSTSFLSQTTCQDNDSLIGSLPPSMGSSVNSSFNIGPMLHKHDSGNLSNSGTFSSLLESSERLLNGRPRYQPYKPFFKPQPQNFNVSDNQKENIDEPIKINDNTIDINSTKRISSEAFNLNDSINNATFNRSKTLNVSQKENVNATFQKDNSPLLRNMNMYNTYKKDDLTSINNFNSGEHESRLNVTVEKTELNEIIQAKAKLSLARNTLPNLPNQTVIVESKNFENVSELLARRRGDETFEHQKARESPKRNATFRKESPSKNIDTTIIYVKQQAQPQQDNNIDCDTIVLEDADDFENKKDESCERTMVESSESMEEGAGTSSASRASASRDSSLDGEQSRATSPNMDVHQRNADMQEKRLHQVNSTPLGPLKKGLMVADLMSIENTISPIMDFQQSESRRHSVLRISPSSNNTIIKRSTMTGNGVSPNRCSRNIVAETKTPTSPGSPINTATIIRKPNSRKELLLSPNRTVVTDIKKSPKISPSAMPPPSIPKKTGLPTSKLRQYSSHKELSRIPGGPLRPSALTTASGLRIGERRGVYASNPALSPTARVPSPPPAAPLLRRDSYTIAAPTLLKTQNDGVCNKIRYCPCVKPNTRVVETNNERSSTKLYAWYNVHKPKNTEGTKPPTVVKRQTSGKLNTDTFRRPQSQLITPKDIRYGSTEVPGPQGTTLLRSKTHIAPSQMMRPSSVSGASQLKPRASSVVPTSASATKNLHPATSAVIEATERLRAAAPVASVGMSGAPSFTDGNKRALSALPRPSRLPAPRGRSLRPPSVYSLAPSADQASDHY